MLQIAHAAQVTLVLMAMRVLHARPASTSQLMARLHVRIVPLASTWIVTSLVPNWNQPVRRVIRFRILHLGPVRQPGAFADQDIRQILSPLASHAWRARTRTLLARPIVPHVQVCAHRRR